MSALGHKRTRAPQKALCAARPAESRAADRRQPEMAAPKRAAAIRQQRQAMAGYLAKSMIERTSMLPRRASGIPEATSTAS